ncbi:Cyclin [Ceraceosorus bombacis]|uniref:Cyclin n=1 Tax=Ceraceosorus bombacis TaxID=401625 RepID=A0A0P1B8J9_9BASI|nr:Cyclin [Ceraceosorus bombacis]
MPRWGDSPTTQPQSQSQPASLSPSQSSSGSFDSPAYYSSPSSSQVGGRRGGGSSAASSNNTSPPIATSSDTTLPFLHHSSTHNLAQAAKALSASGAVAGSANQQEARSALRSAAGATADTRTHSAATPSRRLSPNVMTSSHSSASVAYDASVNSGAAHSGVPFVRGDHAVGSTPIERSPRSGYSRSPPQSRMAELSQGPGTEDRTRSRSGNGPASKTRRTTSPLQETSWAEAGPSHQQDWNARADSLERARGTSDAAQAASTVSPRVNIRNSPRRTEAVPDAIATEALRLAQTSPQYTAKTRRSSMIRELQGQSLPGGGPAQHLDLATFPPQDLLRVLAALLNQIATANDELKPGGTGADRRKESRSRGGSRRQEGADSGAGGDGMTDSAQNGASPAPSTGASSTTARDTRHDLATAKGLGMMSGSADSQGKGSWPPITTAALGALGTQSSTLCFHARNVPSISIESYLLRILKYCPTTNDVFLSLLVYFDRMSRMGLGAAPGSSGSGSPAGQAAGLPALDGEEASSGSSALARDNPGFASALAEPHPGMKGFAIDSYNVHRLVIAGVTVASKFFSDVFYTNSRYAKVGGLPVHELNQLELQFLLLNDFHLVIPLDEMQRYANQLLVYGSGQWSPSRVRDLAPPEQRAVQAEEPRSATSPQNTSSAAMSTSQ